MDKQPNILLVITDHQAFYGHNRPGEFDYGWPRFEEFCAESALNRLCLDCFGTEGALLCFWFLL